MLENMNGWNLMYQPERSSIQRHPLSPKGKRKRSQHPDDIEEKCPSRTIPQIRMRIVGKKALEINKTKYTNKKIRKALPKLRIKF